MEEEGTLPPDPDRRPESVVMLVWAAGGALATAGAGLVLSAALPVLDDVDGMPDWVRPVLIALVVLLGIVSVFVAPALRYRVARYAVRDDELDLQHGWFVVTRTIVPMARVQHVETGRSWIGEFFGIVKLTVHTAAGSVDIPGLREDTAVALRTQIARRAQVMDDV